MAELRKQEEERRLERKVQRERDDEGELFASKDSFVTSAYKKKMQERERLEEVERHRDAMEGDSFRTAFGANCFYLFVVTAGGMFLGYDMKKCSLVMTRECSLAMT